MELTILNTSGKETGRKVNLDDSIFGIEPNDHAIYLDSKQYMANQRQGTHKSKHRGEVAASTRKIKRQKGTGGQQVESMDLKVVKLMAEENIILVKGSVPGPKGGYVIITK